VNDHVCFIAKGFYFFYLTNFMHWRKQNKVTDDRNVGRFKDKV